MLTTIAGWVPKVHLTDEAFISRHRVLLRLFWVSMVLVLGVAAYTGEAGFGSHDGEHADIVGSHHVVGQHAAMFWGVVIAAVIGGLLGYLPSLSRRARAAGVSTALLLAAVALVHGGGGLTDLHFGFFVVIAMIGMYQDWVPLAVGVVLVAGDHLIVGLIAPTMLFSDPRAQASPAKWALMHAAFVLAMCVVLLAQWRFTERAQKDAELLVGEANEKNRQELSQAADQAARREQEATADAAARLAEREQMAAQLDAVLSATAETGRRIGEEASTTMSGVDGALVEISSATSGASQNLDKALSNSTEAREVIASLERSVEEISSVAQLIHAVADQTNLLALNATIEAARAGEAGRGFGVVADEVKTLASQTGAATARIEETVAEVRTGADAAVRAVTAMGSMLDRVVEAQHRVQQIVDVQSGTVRQAQTALADAARQISDGASVR